MTSSKLRLVLIVFIVAITAAGIYFKTRQSKTGPQLTNQPVNKSTSKSKIAFVRDYNLWISTDGVEKNITDDALVVTGDPYPYATTYYSHPSISPDGTKIAFFKTVFTAGTGDGNGNKISLYMANIDGTDPKPLIENGDFYMTFAPLWLNDNQHLLLNTIVKDNQIADQYRLVKLNINTNEQQNLTGYTIGSGCGGGSDDPSQGLTGVEGAQNIYSINFRLSPDNRFLTHSLNCTGDGVALINLDTKEQIILNEHINQVIFAPDSSVIAGIIRNDIAIYDTTGKLISTVKTSSRPNNLYFGPDKMLYYASATLKKSLIAKQGDYEMKGSENISSLWRVMPDGTDTKLFDLDAYAIRPLYINSRRAYLSQIENSTNYFTAVSSGQTNLTNTLPNVNFVTVDATSGAILNSVAKVEQAVTYP